MNQLICPISGEPMTVVFSEIVRHKHTVNYHYCASCGLLKTEKPYWLDEAYQEAIVETDTGLVSRNIEHSKLLEVVLKCLRIPQGRFLDVAGGYGLLTRLMRDKGYDCYTSDKCCRNVFAKAFEPRANFKADALFAFEALEHIEDPFLFVDDLFKTYDCKTLIFSTLTFTGIIPSRDWWYYGFESGQHITFYQPRTLSMLARRLRCNYYKITPSFHMITDVDVSFINRHILINRYFRKIYSLMISRTRRHLSKTWTDRFQETSI